MDLKRGFIKLPRDILGSELWETDEPYSKRDAWIYLVLNAAHEETEVFVGGRKIKLEVGQLVVTHRGLCREFKWGINKLNSWLKSLIERGLLSSKTQEGRGGCSILTLLKCEIYMGASAKNGGTFSERLAERLIMPENGCNTSVSASLEHEGGTFNFKKAERLPYNYITRNTRMCALNNNSTNYKEYYYTLPLDKRTHTVLFLGKFENVGLTLEEYEALEREYGEIDEVIDELSDAARVYPKKYGGDAYAHMLRFIRQKKRVDGASGEKKRRKLE